MHETWTSEYNNNNNNDWRVVERKKPLHIRVHGGVGSWIQINKPRVGFLLLECWWRECYVKCHVMSCHVSRWHR